MKHPRIYCSMDTIIYVSYTKSEVRDVPGECSYTLKEHMLQDYRLIKVRLQEKIPVLDEQGKAPVRKISLSLGSLGKRLQYRHNRRLQVKARDHASESLRQELTSLLQDRDDIRLCYDESVGKDSWTRQILPFREFDEFLDRTWVCRLLSATPNHHFIVFGDVHCIREVLWELAPRMKSLLWIAPDRAAEEELENFAEEFYQETGLAIRLQFLPVGTTYGQFTVPEYLLKEPVNILDFADGKHIPRLYPTKGSVWLDFASDSDKERRIRARRLLCSLISLRKQWKNAPFA